MRRVRWLRHVFDTESTCAVAVVATGVGAAASSRDVIATEGLLSTSGCGDDAASPYRRCMPGVHLCVVVYLWRVLVLPRHGKGNGGDDGGVGGRQCRSAAGAAALYGTKKRSAPRLQLGLHAKSAKVAVPRLPKVEAEHA
eukprot:6175601-Pleurochrysis_carterae.AAC.4